MVMSQLERIRSRPTLMIGACGVLATAAALADEARAQAPLSLVSGVPSATIVDLGGAGSSAGDITVFRAPMNTDGGAPDGQLLGVQTTLGVGPKAQTVQSAMTFDLTGGQIAVAGLSQLDRTTTGLTASRSFTRAVVGGTGDYRGMRGTVTSTRRPDGTYSQRFALTPAATSGGRTLTVFAIAPDATTIDLGAPGASPGDVSVIASGDLVDAAGAPAGVVRGLQRVVRTDEGPVSQAQLTYRLKDGDIVVGGLSAVTPTTTHLVSGQTFVRPILGGTGAYAGMSGTLTSTRGADGRYEQRFDLLPGTGQAKAQTLRYVSVGRGGDGTADVGPAGVSAGDHIAYSGPLRNLRGRRIGYSRGVQTTIGVAAGVQTVASQLTFSVRGRGDLVVGGLSDFPTTGRTGTVRGKAQVRAVLGGTGDFAGAHGTMRAVRDRDGSYRVTFSLSGAPSRKR